MNYKHYCWYIRVMMSKYDYFTAQKCIIAYMSALLDNNIVDTHEYRKYISEGYQILKSIRRHKKKVSRET